MFTKFELDIITNALVYYVDRGVYLGDNEEKIARALANRFEELLEERNETEEHIRMEHK